MKPRPLAIRLVSVALLVAMTPSFALADECVQKYEKFGRYQYVRASDYDGLSKVKVKTIFPDPEELPEKLADRKGENKKTIVIDINKANRDLFRNHFDAFVRAEGRREGGIPADELKEFRGWLKKQEGGDKSPYPSLRKYAETLYRDYVLPDRTLAEFYEDLFLDFIHDTRDDRYGGIKKYRDNLDRSRLATFQRIAKRKRDIILEKLSSALEFNFNIVIIGYAVSELAFLPLRAPVVEAWHQTRDATLEKARALYERWSPEAEDLAEKEHQLRGVADEFGRTDFSDSRDRDQGLSVWNDYLTKFRGSLGRFQPVLPLVDPKLESNVAAKLNQHALSLDAKLTRYEVMKKRLAELAKKKDLTEELRTELAGLPEAIYKKEKEIAAIAADWMLFKYSHPDSRALEPETKEAFDDLLENYQRNMDLNTLRDRFQERLTGRLDAIEQSGVLPSKTKPKPAK